METYLESIGLEDLLNSIYSYLPNNWKDEVIDPEGDNSQEPTPFSARRANHFETAIKLAHKRLNDIVAYQEDADLTQKNLRFEFLLLKASVASGLTTNMLVENFETLEGITLIAGKHDPDLQRIYLP